MSIAAHYDIFDIRELAEFTGSSSFFITENCLLVCVYDRLFVMYDRFSNTSCKFQIFVLTFQRMFLLVVFD